MHLREPYDRIVPTIAIHLAAGERANESEGEIG